MPAGTFAPSVIWHTIQKDLPQLVEPLTNLLRRHEHRRMQGLGNQGAKSETKGS